ncbi:MAG: Spy/CpxP family protein refolding chaperone [Bryobacteraceae bacterium]
MTHRAERLLLLLALMVASIAVGLAQPPGGFRGWAREIVERWAVHLSLTETQKQQALRIYKDLEEETRPLERKIMEQRLALREAVKNSAPDWQIDQIAGALGALTGQVVALESKADAKFYSLLTPEQRERWAMPFGGRRGPAAWPPKSPPNP